MDDKKLREMFRESEHSIRMNDERKRKTLSLLRKEISKKKIVLYDKKIIVKNQFIYMDKTSLLVSTVSSFIIMVLIYFFHEWGWKNREVIAWNSIFSSVLSVLSLVGVCKVFFFPICELEESCYFNLKQIVAFQMICHGILSLTGLLVVVILVGYQWKIMFFQVGLYIFVPYVFTQCCSLFLFLTKTGRQSSYLFMVVGIFIGIAFGMVAMIPQIYTTSASLIWMIAFLVGIAILGVQIQILFQEIEKGEILCMS